MLSWRETFPITSASGAFMLFYGSRLPPTCPGFLLMSGNHNQVYGSIMTQCSNNDGLFNYFSSADESVNGTETLEAQITGSESLWCTFLCCQAFNHRLRSPFLRSNNINIPTPERLMTRLTGFSGEARGSMVHRFFAYFLKWFSDYYCKSKDLNLGQVNFIPNLTLPSKKALEVVWFPDIDSASSQYPHRKVPRR